MTTKKKTKFKWGEGSRRPGDANVVGCELYRLARKGKGRLTPVAVVREASKKASPLHRYFTWDDTAAAQKQRETEARELIRAVVTVVTELADPIRALVNVNESVEKSCYVPIRDAMADPKQRQEIVSRANAELQAWRRKYNQLKEFAAVFTAIDALAV